MLGLEKKDKHQHVTPVLKLALAHKLQAADLWHYWMSMVTDLPVLCFGEKSI